MHNHRLLTSLALSASLLSASAVSAHAADPPTAIHLQGAYAYLQSGLGDGKTYATTVFRTQAALPRATSGGIAATGALDGTRVSLTSIRGASGHRCYQLQVEVRNGRVLGGRPATIGSKHQLRVATKDGTGTATRDVRLRAQRAGDERGAPLGC